MFATNNIRELTLTNARTKSSSTHILSNLFSRSWINPVHFLIDSRASQHHPSGPVPTVKHPWGKPINYSKPTPLCKHMTHPLQAAEIPAATSDLGVKPAFCFQCQHTAIPLQQAELPHLLGTHFSIAQLTAVLPGFHTPNTASSGCLSERRTHCSMERRLLSLTMSLSDLRISL